MDEKEKKRIMAQTRSAAGTQIIRTDGIGAIVRASTEMLEKNPERTSLDDLDGVKRVARDLLLRCADIGILPSFEALAASLGYSRRGLYQHLERHPDSATSEYLDVLRTSWAAARIAAAEKGLASEPVSIFLLLNSALGFTNQHEVRIESGPSTPLDSGVSPENVRAAYVDALPDD